jgi:hypothetical protein
VYATLYTQAQVNVIAHGVPFQQHDPFLIAQIPQDSTYRRTKHAIDDFSSVFRNEDRVILAFPTNMC